MRAKLVSCLMVLLFAGSASAELAGYWKLDDGAGTTATDSSGKGNHGTLIGAPQWVAGYYRGALQFNGQNSYVEIPTSPSLEIRGRVTVAAWVKWTDAGDTWLCILANGQQNGPWENYGLFVNRSSRFAYFTLSLNDTHTPNQTANNTIEAGRWQHLCGTWDGAAARIYVDGKLLLEQPRTGTLTSPRMPLRLGHRNGSPHYFSGTLDEVAVFNQALTQAEIQKVMGGITPPQLAADPRPEDAAVDVPRDVTLGWTAGKLAATHDVYFGTAFADVNGASRTDKKGVLTSQGQTEATFDPTGLLAYGQTYYWRIDEVNKAPDNTIFKGEVWSFTAEPYGYPVKPVKATASSYQAGMGPENTINGSGLDKSDLHSTEPTTMWLSAGAQPNWVQYEFDKTYKLHQLLVWNSNQLIESFLGFGAKKVTVETSTDGTTWTALANVPEFGRGPGAPGYAANTTVNFGAVEAKFVKLTINTNWGGMAPQTGLAEVRFSYVPVQARAPQPAAAATGVSIDADLNWRPGREARSHSVYFGTDPNALGAAKKMTDHSFDPGSLNFGTRYYWKVEEVNAVTYPGDLWSFTTQEYRAIDDFESYTDKAGEEVFTAWVDGVTDGRSNSVVGLGTAAYGTFCETTIVHGGKMAMPFEYNNVKPPFYSEATRTFDQTQDWTGNGANTLSLWVRGSPVDFIDEGKGAFTVGASGHDIWDAADDFRFVCKQLNGDGSIVVKVDSLANTNVWAKAGVMIRQSFTDGSPMVDMIVSAASGVAFQWRPTTGANAVATNSPTVTGVAAPQWVKLTRKGNDFTAQYSADGQTWLDIKNPALTGTVVSVTVNMPSTVYVGLCVSSHDRALTTTAEFSGVATTGNVSGTWQQMWIGDDPDRTNDPASLYVVVEDKAGKKKNIVNPDAGAVNKSDWTEWRIPFSDLTSINVAAVKKLTIGVGDGKAGGAGRLYMDDIGFGKPAQ